jgi:hypothetical protein
MPHVNVYNHWGDHVYLSRHLAMDHLRDIRGRRFGGADVYAGGDDHVYRRGGAGHWQEHSRGGGWAGLRGPAAEHEQWHQAPHGRRAFLLLGIWASFLIGALLGGAATSRFGVWVLLLSLLILLALAVFSRPQSANPDSSA